MAARKSSTAAKKRAKSRASSKAAKATPVKDSAKLSATVNATTKRKRGRPKGSKNKPKGTVERAAVYILGPDGRPQLRGRGRPPKGAIFVNADGTPISGTAAAAPAAKVAAKGKPGRPRKDAGAPKRGRGRPRKNPVATPVAAPAAAPAAPAQRASTSRASSSMRATVVQASSVTFLSTGSAGNIVAGSSVYVDGRSVYADGNGLCVIPGSLIFVDSGAAPDQLGLAVTGSGSAVRVAFDQSPNEANAPYKAVIANFRR